MFRITSAIWQNARRQLGGREAERVDLALSVDDSLRDAAEAVQRPAQVRAREGWDGGKASGQASEPPKDALLLEAHWAAGRGTHRGA